MPSPRNHETIEPAKCRSFCSVGLARAILVLVVAHACRILAGQTTPADASPLTEASPAERFKAFMASPPVIREMVVKRSYPARGGAVPDRYYLIRYQPGAFLYASASALEPLLNPPRLDKTSHIATNTPPDFAAAGRYGTNWWLVSGLARAVTSWKQKADEAGTNNPVWLACATHFQEGIELLYFGINDITLSPDIIGTWRWADDTFQFHAERPRGKTVVKSSFFGRILKDDANRVATMRLDKTYEDPDFGKPRSWSYEFQYLYEPGPRPDFLPSRTKKYLIEGGGARRALDELVYLRIDVSETPLPQDMFMPDIFTTPRSFKFFVEGDNVYYYDEDGNKRRRLASNDVDFDSSNKKRVIFYSVLVLLALPLVVFYLRGRNCK